MNDASSQNKGMDEPKQSAGSSGDTQRRKFLAGMGGLGASVSLAPLVGKAAGPEEGSHDEGAIVLKAQGSFAVGGIVVTTPGTFDPFAGLVSPPAGQTVHGH